MAISEKRKKYLAIWREKNRENIRKKLQQWRLLHPGYDREWSRKWRLSHPYSFQKNRQFFLALTRDNWTCRMCKMTNEKHKEIWNRAITVDHIDGKGRYSSIKNHNLENLQTLCLRCHGLKDGKRRKLT